MKVITICGSMLFAGEMKSIAYRLETKKGYCVLQPVYSEGAVVPDSVESELKQAHFRRIDISDGIYVVNKGGYIGESVRAEIDYAEERGKEVIYHEAAAER